LLTFDTPEQAARAAADLNRDQLVEFAHVIEPRYLFARKVARRRRRSRGVDPMLNRQWGLTAVKLAQAQQAARFAEATSVKIGVIDSGIDAGHPDLQGIFVDEQNFTPGALKDAQGHGTHVSGIIAAVSNNRVGVSGVCQSKKIYSLKALGPYDGPGYYRAIRYAISQEMQVVNFSLGGGHDPTEELLIKQAIRAGIVIVAAMGNDKLRGNPTSYPAAIEGVIAVGATDEVDARADFSQTGDHIHLVAPGVNILSTVPTYPSSLASTRNYEAWPGTSMATPFVTAAVALMLAKKPSATVAQIRRALAQGVDRVDGQTGFNDEYGHGRLNVVKCLAAI
jgi:subtilisin family serine protease